MTRRRLSAAIVLVLVSCNGLPGSAPKGPSGPLGDVARAVADLESPNTTADDPRFDDFLALLDLKTELGDRAGAVVAQIKAGRAAVTKRAAATSIGRLASVRGVLGESIVLEFATTLGNSLDEFTKASGTHEFPPLPPTSHTDEDAQTVTTSSRSQTQTLKSTGPQVTLTIVWGYRETTKDKATGATVAEIVEERTMTGSINVCPDDQGAVGAFVDVKGKFTGVTKSKTVTHGVTSSSVFTGYVDDSATLRRVHHVVTDKQEWAGGGENGQFDMTMAFDSAAADSGSFVSGMDQGSVTGALTGNADGLARASRLGGLSIALNEHSLDNAYQQAQRLWRNGRCVMVTAPDYGPAETPIDVGKQTEPQHDEAVDMSSETKFSVDLKHRFGGLIKAPITTSLSGQKSLSPNRVESAPAQLTFKAPDEDAKKSTATLKSISKRGIGTLVLDFHTGGALTLTINGEVTGNSSYIGTVRVLDTVRIGPLEFKKLAGDIWQGAGTWTAETSSFTTVPGGGGSDTCTGTESGTITLMATVETRGKQRVWVIDPADSDVQGKGTTTCQSSQGDQTLRGVTIPGKRTFDSDGDSAELFMGNLDPFTVPADGGTVRVHGTSGNPVQSFTSDGTAKATK